MGKNNAPFPYLKREGTVKAKNLRTIIKGVNHLVVMVSSQGYNSTKERADSEAIALEALFRDPKLKDIAEELALELVCKKLGIQYNPD
jgi:hypothetical protein